jgi:hypothetical protein
MSDTRNLPRIVCLSLVAIAAFVVKDASAAVCEATPDKAVRSITSCMAESNSGDVILLAPGVYTDGANGGYETFPIQMKAGVALVGRNAENTMIIGTGNISSRIPTITGDSAGIVIDNVTVSSDDWVPIALTEMSTAVGAVVKNSIIEGRLGIQITNDVAATVDNCEVLARDGHVSLRGTLDKYTLKATISNSVLTGTGPTQTTGEAAMGGSYGDSLTITNVTVTNMLENIQAGSYNEIAIDRLNGVNNINVSNTNLFIENSKLGYLTNDGNPVSLGNRDGTTKVVNTMLVGGLEDITVPNVTMLLNCFDEDLNPVSNVNLVANPNVATGSITALLAKAQPGDTIKIPAGVYTDWANGGFETFPLQMKAGVSLIGEGAGSTIIQGTGDLGNRIRTIEGDSAGVVLENLTISSIDWQPVWLDTMSTADGALIKDCIIQGRGGVFIANDVAITVDGTEVYGRDGLLSFNGTTNTRTMIGTISNTILAGTGPTQTTGEAAIFGGNGASLTLTNVTIKNLLENMQVRNYDNIVIDHLNGVNHFNLSNTNLLIQNSKLGFLTNDGQGVTLGNNNGSNKVVNTMFVNGLQSASGQTTLSDVYDENLAPVTMP